MGVGLGRRRAREKVGFTGRAPREPGFSAAAAETAAAAAVEAARFDRELAVSRRREVSPVAAEVVPAVLTLCLACRFFCDHPIEWQSVTPTATYSATHPVFATNASGQVTQLRCVAPPALASPYG